MVSLTSFGKLVFGVLAGFVAIWFVFLVMGWRPVADEGVAETVVIRRGEGVQEIGERLEVAGLVRSASLFRLYAFMRGAAHVLKPGHYQFSPAQSTAQIAEAIAVGPQDPFRALIIEGSTLKEVDEDFHGWGFVDEAAFTALTPSLFEERYPFLKDKKTLEGFLFPDTYHLSFHTDVTALTRTILDAFQEKAWPLLENRSLFYETLIVASLLEKEVVSAEDRRLVAGIIQKREREGMLLQIDATVVYAKCGEYRGDCAALSRSDYSIDSPFNTYRVKGLPPAPISNPGLASIEAALHPKDSPYYFYLTDPKTKRTIFSRTLEEHNVNRARYLGL